MKHHLYTILVQEHLLAGAKALRASSHLHQRVEDSQQGRVGRDGEARWVGFDVVAVHRR